MRVFGPVSEAVHLDSDSRNKPGDAQAPQVDSVVVGELASRHDLVETAQPTDAGRVLHIDQNTIPGGKLGFGHDVRRRAPEVYALGMDADRFRHVNESSCHLATVPFSGAQRIGSAVAEKWSALLRKSLIADMSKQVIAQHHYACGVVMGIRLVHDLPCYVVYIAPI